MSRIVIGFVGGVASGKSTVARLFAKLAPGDLVDADAIAVRVRSQPSVRDALKARFRATDPSKLAKIVFSDPKALADLEQITHPPIRRALERAVGRAQGVVYLDAALLQESGADQLCDAVVYVACPARRRRARSRRNRGWSEADHRRREANQWPCVRKRARADFVVDNGGDEQRTRRDVASVLKRIKKIHVKG
ncbi:MAG: dephospho-CoA kinase [Planctomycetota bacterium]|jgi:dephospho-CoA kinase